MTALTTAALDLDDLIGRAEANAAAQVAFRHRVSIARAARPCASCGAAAPTRRYLTGQLCASCTPPAPGGAYCAPGRCYCPGGSCTRPADSGIGQLGAVLVMAAIGVVASLLALLLWRLTIRWLVGL